MYSMNMNLALCMLNMELNSLYLSILNCQVLMIMQENTYYHIRKIAGK